MSPPSLSHMPRYGMRTHAQSFNYFEELDQVIVSVGLVVPRPDAFEDFIKVIHACERVVVSAAVQC